ncbi:MAG: CoA ester lyase [Granulosicoccus sp.]
MSIDCRSALYMPASNQRALAKGPGLAADAIVIDLEDSVSPDSKSMARTQAIDAFQQFDYGYRLRVMRVNTADTQWHGDDIEAASRCRLDAIVLPKVDTVDHVAQLSDLMDSHPSLSNCAIWAMLESPLAVVNATAIAACSAHYQRLSMFLVGNNDMARAAGMPVQSDRTYLLPWLMSLVAAAKAHGLQMLDGVYNDFADTEGFENECVQGATMGMNGKTLIHPSQIVAANAAYSPSDVDIDTARTTVDTFALPENAGKGAISINGRMTERLHLEMAEQLLQRVQRLSERA